MKIPVTGTLAEIQTQVMQLIHEIYLLKAKDVGLFVGEPASVWEEREFSSSIQFHLTSAEPGTSPRARGVQRVQITLPAVDINKLTYKKLRDVVGGSKGYKYGNWLAVVRWENLKTPTLVFASTKKEATEIADNFINICTLKPLKYSVNEYKPVGERKSGKSLVKRNVRVYPSSCVIQVFKPSNLDEEGRPTSNGRVQMLAKKINIAGDKAKDDYQEAIDLAKRFRKNDKAFN